MNKPESEMVPRYYVLTYGGEPVSRLYEDKEKAEEDLAERNKQHPHDQEQRRIVPLYASPQAVPSEQPIAEQPQSDKANLMVAVGSDLPPAPTKPAQVQMPIALADYTEAQVDALGHREIADRLRRYSHPLLKAAADSIDYFRAQDGLLEKAQREAERMAAELAETKRPLDAQMARLNDRVTALNQENFELKDRLAACEAVSGEVPSHKKYLPSMPPPAASLPVSAPAVVRMLTEREADDCECMIFERTVLALQRKFCEVNGLKLAAMSATTKEN